MATPLGHILDEDTFALWRMDDAKNGFRRVINDSGPLGLHLTATTDARSGRMRPLGPNGEAVRQFRSGPLFSDAPVTSHTGSNHATVVAALKQPWTVEFFIYLHAATRPSGALITFGASNAVLLRVDIAGGPGDSRPRVFWEVSGADQNVTYNDTGQPGFTDGTWHHCAIVKDTSQIHFYIDGVLKASKTKPAEPNGSSSTIYLGSNLNVNLGCAVTIKDLKISTIAKDGTAVAAAAALLGSTFELPLDGNTLVLWRMNADAEIVRDASETGLHLFHREALDEQPRAAPPLIQTAGGRAIQLWGGYLDSFELGELTQGAKTEALRQLMLSGPFTFECWYRCEVPNPGQRGLWCFGDPGLTPAADNFLTVDILADGKIQWWSEFGADLDSVVTSVGSVPTTGTHHLALRRNANVETAHEVDIFIDGEFFETLEGIIAFTGGDDPDQKFVLGYGATEGGNPFFGYLDDVRISSVARSDAEILESYRRGIGYEEPPVPDDDTAPVVVVVSPTPGAAPGSPGGFPRSRELAERTPVVLRVYDLVPGLAHVSLSVVVPTMVEGVLRDVEEVVYRRGQFRGRHIRGSTQRVVIATIEGTPTEVLELSVRREGGWPRVTSLRFFAEAVDAAGNVEGP